MESKDINPKEELEDYKLEVKGNNLFLNFIGKIKNNVKLLPSNENQNYKLTNRSIEYMWKIGEAKAHIVKFFDTLHLMLSVKNENKVNQDNIDIQIIKDNKVIENISNATKKIRIIAPIIPKNKEIFKSKED